MRSVQLSHNLHIKYILGVLKNNTDIPDDSHRLRDVTVAVGMTASSVNSVCGFFAGPGTLSQLVVLDCPPLTMGRYVEISMVTEYLTLCEVDVFGASV